MSDTGKQPVLLARRDIAIKQLEKKVQRLIAKKDFIFNKIW